MKKITCGKSKRVFNYKEVIKAFQGVDRKQLSAKLKTSTIYINMVAGGFKVVSALRAKKIEALTDGRVKKEILRPDIFA